MNNATENMLADLEDEALAIDVEFQALRDEILETLENEDSAPLNTTLEYTAI